MKNINVNVRVKMVITLRRHGDATLTLIERLICLFLHSFPLMCYLFMY